MSPRQACVHLIVRGAVQGVGFRFFAERLALRYGVTGYVRNLLDDTVEIEAEGDHGLLNDFLKEVSIGPRAGYVSSVDAKWKPYTGSYQGFRIRF